MIALVPTVSCLMGKSDVAVTTHFVEPCSIFAMLIGYPDSLLALGLVVRKVCA